MRGSGLGPAFGVDQRFQALGVEFGFEACGFGRGPKPPITRFQLSHLTRDFVYDLTKARTQLGYAPTIDLPQGLETVELPA